MKARWFDSLWSTLVWECVPINLFEGKPDDVRCRKEKPSAVGWVIISESGLQEGYSMGRCQREDESVAPKYTTTYASEPYCPPSGPKSVP